MLFYPFIHPFIEQAFIELQVDIKVTHNFTLIPIILYKLSQGKEKPIKNIPGGKKWRCSSAYRINRMKKGHRTRISVKSELTVRVRCERGNLRVQSRRLPPRVDGELRGVRRPGGGWRGLRAALVPVGSGAVAGSPGSNTASQAQRLPAERPAAWRGRSSLTRAGRQQRWPGGRGGGGGARSAARRPGRSRGLQRSRAEPEPQPSPDTVRPPSGSPGARTGWSPRGGSAGSPTREVSGPDGTQLEKALPPQ